MNSKKKFKETIFYITFLSTLPGILSVIVDPFHIFHKPIIKNHGFNDQYLFYHVAGMINNYLSDPAENYTAIVIGNSTAYGYTQSAFEKTLNWGRTLNLSINGSNPQQNYLITNYALRNKNVKHVFIDISYHYAYDDGDYDIYSVQDSLDHDALPAYLYNESWLDDYKYIFNITTVINAFKIAAANTSDFSFSIENNEILSEKSWQDKLFSVEKNEENMKKNILPNVSREKKHELRDYEIQKIKYPSIDRRLLPITSTYCNKDLEIILNISPRARYAFSSKHGEDFFYAELYMRRYLVENTKNCKNIRVFATDNLDEITEDSSNYMDEVHFKSSIHEYILGKIQKNDCQLTMDNIGVYERTFIEKSNAYQEKLQGILAN